MVCRTIGSKFPFLSTFNWDLETVKNEYHEMISSVKAAWALIGHKLKNHSNTMIK